MNPETLRGVDLKGQMDFHLHLFGRRNAIFLPGGLRDRVDYLSLGVADLHNAIRKNASPERMEGALARVISRTFCVAEYIPGLPIVEGFARKYPLDRCSYCEKKPCECEERRAASTLLSVPHEEQLAWSLRQWQEHLGALYGEKNQEKGVEYIFGRLYKETVELLSIALYIMSGKDHRTYEEIEEEVTLECCDTLAWNLAVANYYEIDSQEAFIRRYGDGCKSCGANPCVCTNHRMSLVSWEITDRALRW